MLRDRQAGDQKNRPGERIEALVGTCTAICITSRGVVPFFRGSRGFFLLRPRHFTPAALSMAPAGFALRRFVPRASFGTWANFRRTRCIPLGGSGFCRSTASARSLEGAHPEAIRTCRDEERAARADIKKTREARRRAVRKKTSASFPAGSPQRGKG